MPNPENLIPYKKGSDPRRRGHGRPKGSLNIKTIINKWLLSKEEITHPITGETVTLTQMDIITLAQLTAAKKGNTQAFNALMDRAEGRPIIRQADGEGLPEGTTINIQINNTNASF